MVSKGKLFVLLQFLCIIGLLLYQPLFYFPFGFIVQLFAIFLGVWAIITVRKGSFSIFPEPSEQTVFIQTGSYKLIRHPMYTSILLFFLPSIVLSISIGSLFLYFILLITLILKLTYEEKLLLEKFPIYAVYQKKTKRLIPFIY